MKKRILQIASFLVFIITFSNIFAQDWVFEKTIKFPDADSNSVNPYLITLDQNNRLYIISSKVTSATAHNSIFYLNYGDSVIHKFIDYDLNGDSDTLLGHVGALRGISTLGNDIYVMFTQPYPKFKPSTVSGLYIYKNADTLNREAFRAFSEFGGGTGGYGSFNHGFVITEDSIGFTGISYGTTFRLYNYGYDTNITTVRGTYIPPYPGANWDVNNIVEPGGPEVGGVGLIRDVALVPGVDYSDSTQSVFYTTRNSNVGVSNGGVARWTGGNYIRPINYTPVRILQDDYFLDFDSSIPFGIFVDSYYEYLWVAGTDSTRKWVKAFEFDGIYADEVWELPSQFSGDNPDPSGAPLGMPTDVVVTSNGRYAYVSDAGSKKIYLFRNTTVGINEEINIPTSYLLEQNYPNPFNPSTKISFSLPEASEVKLVISNILGQEVATLFTGSMNAGRHTIKFDASNLSSGIYIYTLVTPVGSLSNKMILMK
ncbi:MAG: T9SS type A sorting domain-containing protein [Ignavibacteriales bacterium]|nr:T9SS type A sorting domain-containing protein [Ignavibacteriales bacterium]